MLKYSEIAKFMQGPEESKDWAKARYELGKLLGYGKDIVQYVSDPSMNPKHVAPYAKSILKDWHPDRRSDGQLEMYFNDKGSPLGYSFPEDLSGGIYTDASDDELRKSKIVAWLKSTDPHLNK